MTVTIAPPINPPITPTVGSMIVKEISRPPARTDTHGPQPGQWTYEDYLHLPDDGKRYEIIEGVLYVANAPSASHQYTSTKLVRRLDQFVEDHDLGVVFAAPFEVHLAEGSKPVQPDILFIPKARLSALGSQIFEGAPVLIVEIISPSSVRLDRNIKFTAYEKAGVQEYWLVDLKAHSVEVHTWSNGEYALFGQYTGDELVQSKLLAEFSVKASVLFQPV